MSIEDALKYLHKEVKEALEFDAHIKGITTGSIAVDLITGIGGFPRGRASEVFGWEGCGKTTLLLSACAQAQRKGLYPVYLDPERGVDLSHAERLGFNWKDEKKGLYATPTSMEDTFKMVDTMADAAADIICVDSIPSMVPQKEIDGDIEDMGGIGLRSRMLAQFLARITKTIATRQVALVFANQMRARINTTWGSRNEPTEQAAGGSALKFYTSLRIDMRKGALIKEKRADPRGGPKEVDMIIGNVHHAKAMKNKVAIPQRDCEFSIKFDQELGIYGIDNLTTVIDSAKLKGIIVAGGAGYYKYESQNGKSFDARGNDALIKHLMANAETYREIRAKAGI